MRQIDCSSCCPGREADDGTDFASDEALLKVLYLACKEMGRTSTRATAGRGSGVPWETELNQFDILFPGRLDLA